VLAVGRPTPASVLRLSVIAQRMTGLNFKATPYHEHHHPLQLHIPTTTTMSSIIGRSAFRATRPLRATGINPSSGADKQAGRDALKTGARRDPELYVRRLCTLLALEN